MLSKLKTAILYDFAFILFFGNHNYDQTVLVQIKKIIFQA